MAINEKTIKAGTLGRFNVGLVAAVALINPLAAQLDLAIAAGLGPFQADLASRLSAAMQAQAQLSLGLTGLNFVVALAATARALAELQGSLMLPQPSLQLQGTATLALAATLRAQLGLIQGFIKASAAVKLPALNAISGFQAALGAGPFVVFACTDNATLAAQGGAIADRFSRGLEDPDNPADRLAPTDPTLLLCLVTRSPAAFASLQAIISAT